jgi:hypothetical protein
MTPDDARRHEAAARDAACSGLASLNRVEIDAGIGSDIHSRIAALIVVLALAAVATLWLWAIWALVELWS